jgi:hypothetical protein
LFSGKQASACSTPDLQNTSLYFALRASSESELFKFAPGKFVESGRLIRPL